MLERTAAGLESCTLQRVLPKPTKSCRQLHTGFWQHGASAIDLSSIWPGPPRATDSESADVDPGPRYQQTNLLASAFLLDFLYPSATLPLLRRIYPKLPRTQDGYSNTVEPRRRQFSSAAVDLTLDSTTTTRARSSDGNSGEGGLHKVIPSDRPPALENRQDGADSNNHHHSPITGTQAGPIDLSKYDAQETLDRLKQLIDDAGTLYSEIWDLYMHADHQNRLELRAGLVKYLVRSHGVVENGRALSVFRQIPQDEWDNDLLASGILLFLRNADLPSAIDHFKAGLESKGLTGGVEYLLADAISSRKWTPALDVWVAYYTAQAKKYPRRKPSAYRLKELESIPNQGSLYFAFRNFLVSDGAEYQQKLKQSPVSDMALRVFRKHFARMALWEPCSPDQAAIILETLNDKDLYNDYFVRMFDRWYEKLEPQSNIVKLPAMYQKFRDLPNAKPAMPVLRGMFKVHFPKDIAALEQLYQDWIRFRGDLNQWGYEKFLKLYAQRGDVAAVQNLWAKYVKTYPEVLRTPRAFRSTLNVYAQAGDVAQAEKAFQEMSSKYGVEPDVDCWNTLLKTYMRTNDYPQVLRCFDEISKKHAPDSFTYAHVMAMSSKKGDLETTLNFFNRSQEAQVPITKEIGLALVVAYCQNDLLMEAERLCIEMAERKLTHTTIWNQLLNFNGEARDLQRCYVILERMKNFGVQWDDDTHRFLLQALVNVNQIHPAYALLKGAEDEELFSVTPEHYAIVMAGAARVGEHLLVNSLHHRLEKSNTPVSFKALIAVVETAMRQKPGVGRTLNLSKELVEHFRQDVAGSTGEPGQTVTSNSSTYLSANPTMSKNEQQNVGRAIMLLVEMREFGTAEELMTLYNGLVPPFQDEQYPPNVMSALMLAYYKDESLDKVMELWQKTWEQMLKTGKNDSVGRIYSGHEYDLSRVLNVVLRVYRDRNDGQGLSDCIDRVTKEGFKLTCATWSLAIRYLAELGRWQRAMYWCETMLMDGWRGWNWGRNNREKAAMLNTRFLRAPKQLVFRLQQKWLDMRKMAAWSQDVSHQLHKVQQHFPRLYHAFTTSDMETLPLIYQVKEDATLVRDVDKIIRSMPYKELMKAKEQLLKQMAKEKKHDQSLGMPTTAPMTAAEQQAWKQELHRKVRRYAVTWAKRRKERFDNAEDSSSEGEMSSSTAADPDQVVAQERTAYWDDFWSRYDQRPHGERRTLHVKRSTRSNDKDRKRRPESSAASKQRSGGDNKW
ncbi:hypothetical protein QQZ08_006013 [Neonectria magnoliae]|uniref:CoxI translation protein CYA5 n=1 Tax=Neonectria magnoliae TaxID=2732573 RepID=A0ABR1I1P6_9HYPO